MTAQLFTSLGLSTLFNFYKKHKVPLSELEKFENQFEQTGETQGQPLWTAKLGRSGAEIRYFNQSIMDWVWNFRDFFWVYATKHLGQSEDDAGRATKNAVARSDALKLCGYFRNIDNHVELKRFKDYPSFETHPPKLGPVQVHFLAPNGDTVMATDYVGAEWLASTTAFPFIQTVLIEDFPGDRDTRRVAEDAAWEWIELLKALGCDLGTTKPQWFEERAKIDTIVFGATPKALADRFMQWPKGVVGPEIEWARMENLGLYFISAPPSQLLGDSILVLDRAALDPLP